MVNVEGGKKSSWKLFHRLGAIHSGILTFNTGFWMQLRNLLWPLHFNATQTLPERAIRQQPNFVLIKWTHRWVVFCVWPGFWFAIRKGDSGLQDAVSKGALKQFKKWPRAPVLKKFCLHESIKCELRVLGVGAGPGQV